AGVAPEQRPYAQRQTAREGVARRGVAGQQGRRRGGGAPHLPARAESAADRRRIEQVQGPPRRGGEGRHGNAPRGPGGPLLVGADGQGIRFQPLTYLFLPQAGREKKELKIANGKLQISNLKRGRLVRSNRVSTTLPNLQFSI